MGRSRSYHFMLLSKPGLIFDIVILGSLVDMHVLLLEGRPINTSITESRHFFLGLLPLGMYQFDHDFKFIDPTNMIVACDCDNRSNDKIYIIYLNSLTTLFLYCNTECAKALSRVRVLHRHQESAASLLLSHAFVAPSKNSKSASRTSRQSSVSQTQLPSYFGEHHACIKYLHRRLALGPLFRLLCTEMG